MIFEPMSSLLREALAGRYAVPSFCVWNAETMQTVLRAAEDLGAPVILMNGPAEQYLLGPAAMAATARAIAAEYRARAALLLDHGNSIECVSACLAAGYTSVMLDYSARGFAENAAMSRRVVEMARGRALSEASGGITLENVRAVAETGVDFISVGAITHSAPALDMSLELS